MKNLIRKKYLLVKRLARYSNFVRGTISSICSTCHKALCVCAKKSSRRTYRLTYKDDQQKTRIVYVSKKNLPKMRKMIANYARFRLIIDQLIEANIEIYKKEEHF